MSEATALGLPVEIPADIAQPLEIALVVKGLDAEGKVAYWAAATGGLQTVEMIGMMRWAEFVLLAALDADSDSG